jgi:recombination protein RecA
MPLGKVILFRGPEGGTKTTMGVISCARYLQRFPKEVVMYIDAEEKYPGQFVGRLKMDGSRLITAWPETAESTIDFVEYAVREKNVGMLVVDSIAAIVPKIEIEASAADQQQGVAARMINKMCRKIVAAQKAARAQKRKAPTVILINQERMKIGVHFGDPMTLPGGMGQGFASSLTLRFRTMKMQKEDSVGLPEEAPVVKAGVTIFKHSFGRKGLGAEYLLAMEDVGNLHAGEARDQEFVRNIARKRGYISQNGKGFTAMDREGISSQELDEQIDGRMELYDQLKQAITAASGRSFGA